MEIPEVRICPALLAFLNTTLSEDIGVIRAWFDRNDWIHEDGAKIRAVQTRGRSDELEEYPAGKSFELSIVTGDKLGASTNAEVSVELVGDSSWSGAIALGGGDSNFEGGTSETKHRLLEEPIGKLRRLRLWHNGEGRGSKWFVHHVKVVDKATGEDYVFDFQRWISEGHVHSLPPEGSEVRFNFFPYFGDVCLAGVLPKDQHNVDAMHLVLQEIMEGTGEELVR